MEDEVISDKQGISLIIMFIIGISSVIITGIEAKEDIGFSILLAILSAIIMSLIYIRILSLFPGKDLFDIVKMIFGKVIGGIIILLYIWFVFHLSSLNLRDFGEFYITVAVPETPMLAPLILVIILAIWILKEGIEVIGRWAEFFLPFCIGLILITAILLIPQGNLNNLRPNLYQGFMPILKGAFSVFAFPFAEVVVFMMIFSSLQDKKSYRKVYFIGLIISGIIILITSLNVVSILGVVRTARAYFPAYLAVARLNVMDFLQRLEIVVSVVFLLGGFIKLVISMLATCKGIAKLLNYDDYRFIITPVALGVINLNYLIADSIMEFIKWDIKIWPYYAFLFEVILPIIIWIGAEFKMLREKISNSY